MCHFGLSVGIINGFSDFDLRMTPCDLELFLRGGGGGGGHGWSLAGRPFSFELNVLGETVDYTVRACRQIFYFCAHPKSDRIVNLMTVVTQR